VLAGIGAHPRLAHMMLRGEALGAGATATAIAAVLSERDLLRGDPRVRDCDLRHRLELLQEKAAARRLPPGLELDRGALERARELARQWRRELRSEAAADEPAVGAGALLALAYPDRLAQRRAERGSFRLANGAGAPLPLTDALAGEPFLAVAELDGDPRNARILLAAPVSRAAIEAPFAAQIERHEEVIWDSREQAVLARRQQRLRALVLRDEPWPDPPPERRQAAMLAGIRELGLAALPWDAAATQLRHRVQFLRRLEPEQWPDLSDAALLATLEDWLGPYLDGIT